jgi:uncharacterized membrane protein YcaP (DUF421 family)
MQIILRAAAMYFFVWFLTRALGKKEMSQLSVFEMILAVTIGDLIQQGVTQEDQSLTGAMLAVGTIGILILAFSVIANRIPRTRSAIQGVPVILVRDGKPVQRAMQFERVAMDEIKDAARAQGIEDLADVKLAILEPGGSFSFLKREGEGDGGWDEDSEKKVS